MDDKGESFYLNSFPSNIVDPTGAGDAYATGFVYAVITGKTLQDAMCLGAMEASYVIELVGAQDGLVHRRDLDEKMKKFAQYSPEIYNG